VNVASSGDCFQSKALRLRFDSSRRAISAVSTIQQRMARRIVARVSRRQQSQKQRVSGPPRNTDPFGKLKVRRDGILLGRKGNCKARIQLSFSFSAVPNSSRIEQASEVFSSPSFHVNRLAGDDCRSLEASWTEE
jgi:hypothetical protein